MTWFKAVSVLWAVGLASMPAFAEQAHPFLATSRGVLHVRIQGLRGSDGSVRIGLYGSKRSDAARSGSFRKAVLPIKDRACEWLLDGVPYGEYALMFYHDQNGNHHLDKNGLGIPVEPFGFSNNATPRLGLPLFERVKFEVEGDLTTLEIVAQAF